MADVPMTDDAFEELVLRYLDGEADADEVRALSRLVASDLRRADLFVAIAGADALLLEVHAEKQAAARSATPDRPTRRSSTRARLVRAAARRSGASSVRSAALALATAACVGIIAHLAFRGAPADDERGVATTPAPPPRRDASPAHDRTAAPARTPAPAPALASSRGRPDAPDAPATDPRPLGDPSLALATPPAPRAPAVGGPERPPVASAPTRHHLYLDRHEGTVERRAAGSGTWHHAAAGSAFESGDELRTKFARARLVFETGTVLYVNRFTTLSFAGPGAVPSLSLVRGEVFIETAARDVGFLVDTPHGRAVDLGTRFGVKVESRGTTVVTVEGRVAASTEKGSAEVGTGHHVLLARRVSPPGPVRPARALEKRLAWARALEPVVDPWRVVFRDDFARPPATGAPGGWIVDEWGDGADGRPNWAVAGRPGRRHLTSAPGAALAEMLLVGEPDWTDCEIAVRAAAGRRGTVLLLRHARWQHTYRLMWYPATRQLSVRKDAGGEWSIVRTAAGQYILTTDFADDVPRGAALPLAAPLADWLAVRARVTNEGDAVRIRARAWSPRSREPEAWHFDWLDDGASASGPPIRSGRIGIVAYRSADEPPARFDEVIVSRKREGK